VIWFILFLVLLGGVYAFPSFLEKRRKPMNRVRRAAAPGKFTRLSQGVTHYRWIGPTRGPVAVMIHGLTTSSPVWEEIAQAIADAGYRVLVYDLYNRGFSDSVKGPHDTQLYLTQLDDLLADQGLTESLTLVGYSMGGIIATEFAATEPHRMQRLILLASGGIKVNESEYAQFCRTRPVLGDWLHGVWGELRFTRQINEDAAAAAKPHIQKAQVMELDRQGYLPAILACRRGILQETQERQHRAITRDGIPTIAIWGEEDNVIPMSAVGQMAQWNRKAHHEVVKGAGHSLPYSHTEDVVRFLRRMLRGE
jgi:pimeloyl-ACP methyl ester carboxylesterase